MIISTFKTGKGKAKGPLNYLLGNDKDNKPRNPAPEIIKGDKRLTEILIDSNHRQYKYTSGAIAFRDNEKPTQEQIEKIINAFEKTFTPGLEERIPILWVKHEDKGNTELHFICPMQDARTGKQFNICPPGENFKQMYRDFQSLINDKYGWEQVRGNMFKAQMTELDKAQPDNSNNKMKEVLSKKIEEKVKKGELNKRSHLIDFLKNLGFEITRQAKDYISVKHHKAKKATRLKGPAFEDNANYQDLLKQTDKPKFLDVVEKEEVTKRMKRAINNRYKSLKVQFDLEDYPPPPLTLTKRKDVEDAINAKEEEIKRKEEVIINIYINKESIKQPQPTADLPQSKKPNGFKL